MASYKKATGKTGMADASTSTYGKGMKSRASAPSTPSKSGKSGNMGTPAGSGAKVTASAGGFAAGRARTNRGKNSTTSGPQGLRG